MRPDDVLSKRTGRPEPTNAQIEKESSEARGARAKEKRQRVRGKYRKGVVTTKRLGRETANRLLRSFTGENKPKLGGGGRAKASAARAAATRKKNIAASKAEGTYARTAKNQAERNKARARSDARTRVGGGSPGSRVAGGLARVRGR